MPWLGHRGGALENRFRSDPDVGSNPTPSARSTVSRCLTAGLRRHLAASFCARSARRRGDLGRILYEATRHGTEYLFGDSIKFLGRVLTAYGSGLSGPVRPR